MQPNTTNTPHHNRSTDRPPVPRRAAGNSSPGPGRGAHPATHDNPNRPPRRTPDFLTAAQLARRLGVSRETVRRLAIAGALPHTVVCRGTRKTTRRFPRRFADEFAASGLDAADLAAFAAAWRARVTAPGTVTAASAASPHPAAPAPSRGALA